MHGALGKVWSNAPQVPQPSQGWRCAASLYPLHARYVLCGIFLPLGQVLYVIYSAAARYRRRIGVQGKAKLVIEVCTVFTYLLIYSLVIFLCNPARIWFIQDYPSSQLGCPVLSSHFFLYMHENPVPSY